MSMKIGETVSLIAMILLVVVPWFVAGLNIWGWLFVGIFSLVGIFEGYSSWKNGKTISQLFWKFRKEHSKSAIGILITMTMGWILLIVHLLS